MSVSETDKRVQILEKTIENDTTKNMLKLFISKQYSDCIFVIGRNKDEVAAHSLLLSTASKMLGKVALKGGPELILPEVSREGFNLFLLDIYIGEIPQLEDLPHQYFIELWYLTLKFDLLTDFCIKYRSIVKKLNIENCLSIYNYCRKLETISLSKDVDRMINICIDMIAVRPADFLQAASINKLDPSFLECFFSVEDMIISEIELFNALDNYAGVNGWTTTEMYLTEHDEQIAYLMDQTESSDEKKKLIKDVRAALKQIRFRCMSEEQAAQAARAGRLTREEAAAVRARAAPPGFSELAHPRYSTLPMEKLAGDQKFLHVIKNINLKTSRCGQTQPFEINNRSWRIKLLKIEYDSGRAAFSVPPAYLQHGQIIRKEQLEFVLQCLGPTKETERSGDWKQRAKCNVYGGKNNRLAVIDWFCYKKEVSYQHVKILLCDIKDTKIYVEIETSEKHVKTEKTAYLQKNN